MRLCATWCVGAWLCVSLATRTEDGGDAPAENGSPLKRIFSIKGRSRRSTMRGFSFKKKAAEKVVDTEEEGQPQADPTLEALSHIFGDVLEAGEVTVAVIQAIMERWIKQEVVSAGLMEDVLEKLKERAVDQATVKAIDQAIVRLEGDFEMAAIRAMEEGEEAAAVQAAEEPEAWWTKLAGALATARSEAGQETVPAEGLTNKLGRLMRNVVIAEDAVGYLRDSVAARQAESRTASKVEEKPKRPRVKHQYRPGRETHSARPMTRKHAKTGAKPMSVLAITYNFGQAEDRSFHPQVIRGIRKDILKSKPDVVMLTCQEVALTTPIRPLMEALTGTPYTVVGGSDIAGWTKAGGYEVSTVVEVAVNHWVLQFVGEVEAEFGTFPAAAPKANCTAQRWRPSVKTRFYSIFKKGTKGFVTVTVEFKNLGSKLRFVGLHLDTKEALWNIDKMSRSLQKTGKKTTTIIAGDFNIRIGAEARRLLCRRLEKKRSPQEEILHLLGGTSKYPRDLGNKAFIKMMDELLPALHMDLVKPASFKIPGNKEFYLAPTYKYSSTMKSMTFGAFAVGKVWEKFDAEEICKKGRFGALDRVAMASDTKSLNVEADDNAGWRFFEGSDHAMVSAGFRVSKKRKP